jgi:xanthine dehydrogenase accessory factor
VDRWDAVPRPEWEARMREVFEAIGEAARSGRPAVLATVVATRGSTPRKSGARMLIYATGESAGTIGGGCVEAEVWQAARTAMKGGAPAILEYSLTADLAADSGMICGGFMRLFVEPVMWGGGPGPIMEVVDGLLDALNRGETAVLATVLNSTVNQIDPGMRLLVREDGAISGALEGSPLARAIVFDAREMTATRRQSRVAGYGREYGPSIQSAVELYLEVIRSRPRVIVVGAGHVGRQVSKIAGSVGFSVVVVDDRADFADPTLIPEADRVIAAEPAEALASLKIDPNSYVVLVTRGHKQDEAALRQVVDSPAAYVGMIGSRARVLAVKDALASEGFSRERLDAVHAPIGLRIGAETPEEIAISIVAELVKVMRGA